MNDARLGDFLVKIGLITPQQLHTAKEMLETANGQPNGKTKLANIVVSLGFASAEELGRLAATALRLPYVSLDKVNIPKPLAGLLNKEHARKAKGILVKVDGKKFYLATFDPTNVVAFDELQFVLGGRIYPVVATEDEVIKAFGHYYTERIQYDRPFDLPKSDTLDFDKAEVFDIRTTRAKQKEAKPKLDVSGGTNTANRKAMEDRLAAAASTVNKSRVAQREVASATTAKSNALEIRDEVAASPAPKAATPVPAPPKVTAALVSPVEEELPTIRDAGELDAPITARAEAEEELELVELEDDAEPLEMEILDGEADDADEAVVGELETLDGDDAAPAAPASADDLLAMFGALAFGVDPSEMKAKVANPEADELAKLFMGALGGSDAPAAAAPSEPADVRDANELAKELAQMLLGDSESPIA